MCNIRYFAVNAAFLAENCPKRSGTLRSGTIIPNNSYYWDNNYWDNNLS